MYNICTIPHRGLLCCCKIWVEQSEQRTDRSAGGFRHCSKRQKSSSGRASHAFSLERSLKGRGCRRTLLRRIDGGWDNRDIPLLTAYPGLLHSASAERMYRNAISPQFGENAIAFVRLGLAVCRVVEHGESLCATLGAWRKGSCTLYSARYRGTRGTLPRWPGVAAVV